MWRRENVTIQLSVNTVVKPIISSTRREQEARGDGGSTVSFPKREEADVDHQGEADEGLEGYRSSPQEAKKAFLDHLAESIAAEHQQVARFQPLLFRIDARQGQGASQALGDIVAAGGVLVLPIRGDALLFEQLDIGVIGGAVINPTVPEHVQSAIPRVDAEEHAVLDQCGHHRRAGFDGRALFQAEQRYPLVCLVKRSDQESSWIRYRA